MGLEIDTLTYHPLFPLTVRHADTNETFRRFVMRDGTRAVAGAQPLGVGRVRSTTVGDMMAVDVAGVVQAEAGAVLAADDLIMSDADGRAVPFVEPVIRHAVVDGAAASTDIAVAGIATTDTLDAVVNLSDNDVPAGASITSDGNIQSTDATSSDKLLVVWRRPSRPVGRALAAATAAGKYVPVLLGLGV